MHNRLLLLFPALLTLFSCKQQAAPEDPPYFTRKGDSLVTQTFDTLRNTLLRTVAQKGFDGAVEFCSTEALKLTAVYASEGIRIKRTSDQLRNPANAPDTMEQRLLAAYRKWKTEKKELPVITEKDMAGNYHYFKPILMQTMCLNCHGEKDKQVTAAAWKMIRDKYPADAAFNYKEGDWRGIWHIQFSTAKN